MKSLRYTLFILSTVVGITTSAQGLQHHQLNVGDFRHLSVVGSVNVDYKSCPDSAGIAVYDAPIEAVNAVIFSNNNDGKLTIEVDLTEGATNMVIPHVSVYSRSLENIENSGDSTVRAFKVITASTFKAKLEGNGRLSLRDINAREVNARIFTGRGQLAIDGKCDKASLKCTGVGAIQADKLMAVNATVTLNGTGSIGCYVTGTLTIQGIGSGTVYYAGNPVKIKNRAIAVKHEAIGR